MDNIVVILLHAVDSVFQNILAAHNVEQAGFHAGQLNIRRKQVNTFRMRNNSITGRLFIINDRLHKGRKRNIQLIGILHSEAYR